MPVIIEENFTFIVIAAAIILIFIVAYFTFIRPKRKNSRFSDTEKQDLNAKDNENNLYRETFDKSAYLKKSKTKKQSENDETDEDKQSSETTEQEEKAEDEISSEAKNEELTEGEENVNEEDNEDEEAKELGKYHILYRDKDDRWYVKREGSEKTLRVLHTKDEAIAWATIKAINQDTNIVIHNKEGKIEKHGY
ncbi:MAG: DUF2188 domain-containing protein [Bacillota bacterium]